MDISSPGTGASGSQKTLGTEVGEGVGVGVAVGVVVGVGVGVILKSVMMSAELIMPSSFVSPSAGVVRIVLAMI